MGREHRRPDVLVTEQFLHGTDVIPRFEYMGGKGMTQGMDAVAVRDPRGPLRVIVNFLGGAAGHRRVAIEACKQPWGWLVEFPVCAQVTQQAGGQQRVAILTPFALLDADQPALTFNVRELQTDDCTDAQASGIGRHQEDPVSGVFGTREQALEFRDAQHLGELRQRRARREV